MTRTKQRENYGNGSVSPVMVTKDGKKVQERDKQGRLVWRVCITLGVEDFTDKDGEMRKRQRKVQKRVHGTLDDARRVARDIKDGYENISKDSVGMCFADICAAWADSMRLANTCAPQRLKDYERRLSYVADELADKPIIEIKKQDIEQALSAIKACRNLSQRSLREVFALTKRVFRYAVASDWAIRNPCDMIVAPKADKSVTRRSLTVDECPRLRACLDRDEAAAFESFEQKEGRALEWGKMWGRSYVLGITDLSGLIAVRLMFATGMRRGECMGLCWKHIDFDGSQIHIRQALSNEKQIKEPKTASGIRSLYVDADTMAHLRTWKAFQKKALHRVMVEDADGKQRARTQTDETPVCCDNTGGWFDLANFSRWWRAYSKSIGFEGLRVHELRHTQATMLLGNGVDVKTVQTRLGHADASTTLNQYAHAIPANDRAAADIMGAICGAAVEPSARIVKVGQKSA